MTRKGIAMIESMARSTVTTATQLSLHCAVYQQQDHQSTHDHDVFASFKFHDPNPLSTHAR